MRHLLLSLLPCIVVAQPAPEPARIQAFQVSAATVHKGGSVTLRWSVTGATQVRLEPLGLVLPAQGEITHLVTGRTIYWLNASNQAGGQSRPLVVEVLPDEPLPAVLQPALPVQPLAPPVAPTPGLPVAAPQLAALAAPAAKAAEAPAALPAQPVRRAAHRRLTRRAYIQFATMVSTRPIAGLRRNLKRLAATDSTVLTRHRHSGRPFRLIRSGPFPTVQAARQRLRELEAALKPLNLRPIVVLGAPQAMTQDTTMMADARAPE
jgi:hypothetical protein